MSRSISFFLLLFISYAAWSQKKSVTLSFEEDYFWEIFKPSKNFDKDYSGGGALSFKLPFVQKARLTTLITAVDNLWDRKYLNKYGKDNYTETFRLGLTVFTPAGKYLDIATPLPGHRPYASVIFAGTTRNFTNREKGIALTTQFDIGVLGVYAGRESQAYIHRVYKQFAGLPDSARPYDPAGWKNQVSDGGEPTFLYSVTFKKLLSGKNNMEPHYFDAMATWGGSIGFTNSLSGSVSARLGIIRSAWDQFSSFPVPESAFDSLIPASLNRTKNLELYFFATVRPSVMIYSVPLQGQFRHSNTVFDAGEVNHFIGQAEAGITLSFWRITLSGIFIYRSRQYNTIHGKEHSYFSIGVTGRSPF